MSKCSLILAVGIALILPVTLTSALYNDLAEMDFLLPYTGFENVDQESPATYDANSFGRLGVTSFFTPPKPAEGRLEEVPYSSFEIPSLHPDSPVLRC